jgi:hypothetical protein
MALEHESRLYRSMIVDLLGPDDVNEGKYVVIRGDDVLWPLDTYEAALEAGYDRHGLTPFLVQKIERHPTVIYLRDFAVGPAPGPIAGPPDRPGLYWIQTAEGADFEAAEVHRRGGWPDADLQGCWLGNRDESGKSDGPFPMHWITAHLPISLAPPPG